VDRILAAINLEKPDRVPVRLNMGFWPAKSAGITAYQAMSDPKLGCKAWKDFNLKFQPDASVDPLHNTVPAAMFTALDYKLYSWPGHGVSETASYQYNEKEWMVAEDYDALISDPTDFLVRDYMPRALGAFSAFRGVSSFWDYIELPFVFGQVLGWGSDEMVANLKQITAAAEAVNEWAKVVFPAMGEVQGLGFPPFAGSATKAPFDILGDTLRGTKGVIVDMFRRPDKVLAACDRLTQVALDWALKRGNAPEIPLCFMPLHKGADGFMSQEQFDTFYWPTLKRVIDGLVEQGMIPLLFAEGRYNTRLETIMETPKASAIWLFDQTDMARAKETPKASAIWLFDQTDMARAKETIGTVTCIQGNMPLSLMHAGTPEQVAEHTRKLIDIAGKDGGFILDVGAVADEGKDENLLTMVNTAKEYGKY
jgi:hypothetical protein